MTLKHAKMALEKYRMILRKNGGEYRVSFPVAECAGDTVSERIAACEVSSYYSYNLNDAVFTGIHMRREHTALMVAAGF